MKKAILSAIIPIFMASSAVFGAPMISFNDGATPNGATPIDGTSAVDPNSHINLFAGGTTNQTSLTVSPGSTFSLDTYITFTGFTAVGLSYWLEAPTVNSFNSHLTLNSETYFQNWNGIQPPLNDQFNVTGTSNGADNGFARGPDDLGSTSPCAGAAPCTFTQSRTAGTYQVSTLNFSLDASTPAGTYTLQLTTLSPVSSEISEGGTNGTFIDHDVAASTFTLTVVPEPATLSLLGLGGLGSLGLTMLRRRRG